MNRQVKYVLILKLIFLLLSTAMSPAQRTGLVLSGGGAKGLAHIGVIKALEEEGIRIDYISGASMGAVIAALYSMGYTTEEMKNLVTSDEFLKWSRGTIDKELQFTYKNNEPNSAMINVDLKFEEEKPEAKLPSHLIQSAVIDFSIMQLTCGETAAAKNNFDSLMIPFRCVASDIYKKEEVIFRKGNLGNAIRASMAYPLYFEPYVEDSILLFDGGIFNNFPYDILVEDFQPDFIIGSKVVNIAERPDRHDIILQLENMIMRPTDYNIPDSLGYVIDINFENVSLLDFEGADSIIAKGYRNTKKQIKNFRNKTDKETAEELEQKRRKFREKIPERVFRDVKIEGVNERQKSYIINLISHKEELINIKELKEEYFRLVAEENIKSAYPEARYDSSAKAFDLHLDIELKGSYELEAGGLLSMTLYNQAFIGFDYYTLSDIYNRFSGNLYFGRNYSSFSLAHRISVPQKRLLLIDLNLTGYSRNYFTSEITSLFESTVPSYIIRRETNLRTSFGAPVSNNSSIKAGINFSWINDKYYRSIEFEPQDEQDQTSYFYGTAKVFYELNTLNRKQYATEGNYIYAGLYYNLGFERFKEGATDTLSTQDIFNQRRSWLAFKFRSQSFYKISRRISLGALVDIVLSNKGLSNNYTATMIDAYKFEPTPTSQALFGYSLRANSYAGGGLMPVYNFSTNLKLMAGVYLLAPTREIERTENGVEYGEYYSKLNKIGSMSLVYHTPVGPVSAGLNYYSDERKKLFLFVNFGYILFNKSGLD
ncbi:MAG: patatin-like phospholipase family protein [Bacteroidota bacterium]|nr:patatin-like phospholipase family protein [Bacteroidota bacterium]